VGSGVIVVSSVLGLATPQSILCRNSPLAPLFRLLVDTQLDIRVMDRSTDVHEIPLTFEFSSLSLRGADGKFPQSLVGFFVL
jgi:hypothetical protein